ncbi:Ribonuclease Z OS=Stutzerimonas stutzeri OX=316 GN=rnz PE=3 SV=1 [Stutzerimonas stutzeri]
MNRGAHALWSPGHLLRHAHPARNVTGLALQEDAGKAWYLIDCGEGTQHRLLRMPLSLHDLRAIFITHVHGDHCYGLPGLLASAGMMGRRHPLEIIAPAGIADWVQATLRMSHAWLGYELAFHAVESLGEWRSLNMRVAATALSHRVPCYGYSFTEARPDPRLNIERLERDGVPRGPLWGQLARGFDLEHEGRTLRSEDYLSFTRAPARRHWRRQRPSAAACRGLPRRRCWCTKRRIARRWSKPAAIPSATAAPLR